MMMTYSMNEHVIQLLKRQVQYSRTVLTCHTNTRLVTTTGKGNNLLLFQLFLSLSSLLSNARSKRLVTTVDSEAE